MTACLHELYGLNHICGACGVIALAVRMELSGGRFDMTEL